MAENENREKPAVVVELEGKFKRGQRRNRLHVQDAHLTLAFLAGRQWSKATKGRGLVPVPNRTNERRVTVNKMQPWFERRQALMFKTQPVMEAYQGSSDLGDNETALVASRLFDYWQNSTGLEAATRKASAWADITGMAYMAPVWKQSRWKEVKRKKYTARKTPKAVKVGSLVKYTFNDVEEVSEVSGDLGWNTYTSLQVTAFPLNVTEWEKVEGLLIADVVSKEWLEARAADFGLGSLAEDTLTPIHYADASFKVAQTASRMIGPWFGLTPEDENTVQYLYLEYRERPTSAHPNGRWIVLGGGREIYSAGLPYLAEAREVDPLDQDNMTLGLIPFRSSETAVDRLVPISPLSRLRAPQVLINELATDEATNREQVGRNKLLIQKGMLADGQWTKDHAEIVEYEGGRDMPKYLQAPPLSGLGTEQDRAAQTFEELGGQGDVLQGRNPPQVRSAWHLSILTEQAGVLINEAVAVRERALSKLLRLALAIGRRYYTRKQVVGIYGEDHAGRVRAFWYANFPRDVRIKEGSMLPRNHAAQEAKILELIQYGLFTDANGVLDQRKIWKMLDYGAINQNLDPRELAATKASRENAILMDGKAVWVNSYDNHDIELEEHMAYMYRREFEEASDNVKIVFAVHIQEHTEEINNRQDPSSGLGDDRVAEPGEEQLLAEDQALLEEPALPAEQELPLAG